MSSIFLSKDLAKINNTWKHITQSNQQLLNFSVFEKSWKMYLNHNY